MVIHRTILSAVPYTLKFLIIKLEAKEHETQYVFPQVFPLGLSSLTTETENYYFVRKTQLLIIHIKLPQRHPKSLAIGNVYSILETHSVDNPTHASTVYERPGF